MGLLKVLKQVVTGWLNGNQNQQDDDWWAEITTAEPRCTYYFGPFDTADEAEKARPGYVEDLENEGAKGIRVEIKRCSPTVLTIFDENA